METLASHSDKVVCKSIGQFLSGDLPKLVCVGNLYGSQDIWLLTDARTIILIASVSRRERIGCVVPRSAFSDEPCFKEFKGTITLTS